MQIKRAPLKRLAPADEIEELAKQVMPRLLELIHTPTIVLKMLLHEWEVSPVKKLDGRGE
jgi:hypothetical protein